MKRTLLITATYAALATYPAYTQIVSWTNDALDQFAQQRTGVSMTHAKTGEQVAVIQASLPAHLQTPLPMKKPMADYDGGME